MNFNLKTLIRSVLPLALLFLTACGGGDSTTPAKSNLVQQGGSLQGVALNLNKTVSTYASAPPGADGTGAAARFNSPQASVAVGGNLYVADSDSHTIRKIVIATGVVTTLAGQTGIPGAADGTGTAATFSSPSGITTDGTNLYVVMP